MFDDNSTKVTTAAGQIEGVIRTTHDNLRYRSFEGIPYARAPVGHLRFKDPQPLEPWKGVLKADKPGSISLQRSGGSEDCLFLNIYTPLKPKIGGYPVLVYIHGGGFYFGSSTERNNPELFIREGCILATMNYRLGPFGFLCLNTDEVPGNAGMKDQALGLRWVFENAGFFGGDGGKIALIGESAGGVSCQLHQLSPMSRNYIKVLILMSGAALCDFGIQKHPAEIAAKLASKLNIDHKSKDFLKELQNLPAESILKASAEVERRVDQNQEELNFAPVIEITAHNDVSSFLTKAPIEYFNSDDFTDVPIIFGYASKEVLNFFVTGKLAPSLYTPKAIVPDKYQIENNAKLLKQTYDKIMTHFFKNDEINLENNDVFNSAIDLIGDVTFIRPIHETVKVLARKAKSDIFFYRFSYRGTALNVGLEEFGVQGAVHANELDYIFPTEEVRVGDYTSDGWVRRRFVKMFANFAKIGNPTPQPTSHLLPNAWLPVTEEKLNYLEINGENIPSVNPDHERMVFWNNLELWVQENRNVVDSM